MAIDPETLFPEVPFELQPALVLLCRRGSEAHGTFIPTEDPGGIDDRDLLGLVVPPFPYLTGIRTHKGKQWEHAEAIQGVWDVVLHDLRKFVGLLCKQNPSCLSALWLEREDYLHLTECGEDLILNRDLFREREAAYACFAGYAQDQLRKMTSGAFQGYMGDKRKRLVEKYGYDTKNASHLVRLQHMGIEYHETGELKPRRTWDRQMLIDIKRGQWERARVEDYSGKLGAMLKQAYERSVLPEEIDAAEVAEWAESWVGRVVREQWGIA